MLWEVEFVAVVSRTTSIDDQQLLIPLQAYQRHMPGAAMVVDALPAIGHERAQLRRLNALSGWCNDDNHTTGLQRYECLAAERMTFHYVDTKRQCRGRPAARDADRHIALPEIDLAQVIEALEEAGIRRIVALRGDAVDEDTPGRGYAYASAVELVEALAKKVSH